MVFQCLGKQWLSMTFCPVTGSLYKIFTYSKNEHFQIFASVHYTFEYTGSHCMIHPRPFTHNIPDSVMRWPVYLAASGSISAKGGNPFNCKRGLQTFANHDQTSLGAV